MNFSKKFKHCPQCHILVKKQENKDNNKKSLEIVKEYTVIINCSPIGTYPNIDESPNIPYEFISDRHLLFDLIYNPSETKFLQLGKKNGAVIKNGLEMLELQAEKSWEIWNS